MRSSSSTGSSRVDGIVLAGTGADAAALIPYLHAYLRDRVVGTVKLNPKESSEAAVLEVTLAARAEAERNSELAQVQQLEDAHGTGWAVNGIKPVLKALAEGKLRTLLVNADHESPGFRCASGRLTLTERECGSDGKGTPVVDVIDEALEEALRQRVSVEVVRSPRRRRGWTDSRACSGSSDAGDRPADPGSRRQARPRWPRSRCQDRGRGPPGRGDGGHLHRSAPDAGDDRARRVQEDVDVVGLSILSGAHMTLIPRVRALLEEAGRGDILVTGGGIIPPEDVTQLEGQGIGRLFGPGTPTSDLVEYIRTGRDSAARPRDRSPRSRPPLRRVPEREHRARLGRARQLQRPR
jgi:methylmalonyl-CoA mutase cobalamin-binding domain/chain